MTKALMTPRTEILQQELTLFRFWYNHIRPHQNLNGLTPAEVWQGHIHYPQRSRKAYWFEEWDGLLCGYYFPT
jgi:putative transposase